MKMISLVLLSVLSAIVPCTAGAHPTISLTPKEYVEAAATGSAQQIAYTQGVADAIFVLGNGTCPKMRYGEIAGLTSAKIYALSKQNSDDETAGPYIILAMMERGCRINLGPKANM